MTEFSEILHKVVNEGQAPDPDEIEELALSLWPVLYGDYEVDWNALREQREAHVKAHPLEARWSVDLDGALALIGNGDPAPFLNAGSILSDAGFTIAGEILLALSARLSEILSAEDPTEVGEADVSWFLAAELAIENEHLLTAYLLANRCTDEDDRAKLVDAIRERIRRGENG